MAKTDWNREIRITGVPEKLHTELKNIASNMGISMTRFLKVKLKELSNTYDDNMKQPPLID